jgi:truncated hemoglobin YjbI
MQAVRWRPTVLAAVLLDLILGCNLLAQDRVKMGGIQPDVKDQDAALRLGVKNAINQGVVLYNSGDHYGCYRLYQGIVLTLKPILADRPELERALETALGDAEKEAVPWQRAWVLRRALDDIRSKLAGGGTPAPVPASNAPAEKMPKKITETLPKPAPPPEPMPASKKAAAETKGKATLWLRLGDVNKIVDDFYKLAAKDPKVDFTRNGKFKLTAENILRFKDGLHDFISNATGGPLSYDKSMKVVHKDMKITSAQFDAAVADLKKALEANQVAKTDVQEFLKIVEKTRKDIVEEPADANAPAGKTGVKKNDDEEGPPFAQINDLRGQSTWAQAEPRHVVPARQAALRDRLR